MTAQTRTVDQILAGWPSTFDTMGDARKMQEMVEYARTLESELAAARADAERYRWLRSQVNMSGRAMVDIIPNGGDWNSMTNIINDEELDAAIDAARKE